MTPIEIGNSIQIFHICVSFAIWYFVGKQNYPPAILVPLVILPIIWFNLGGCPLTLLANRFFVQRGVGPFHNLFEWAAWNVGPGWALLVWYNPYLAYSIGLAVTETRAKK